MSEGKQVDRYNGIEKDPLGAYVLYEDYQRLAEALKLHCIVCVEMRGHKKEYCEDCATTKALKAAGEVTE